MIDFNTILSAAITASINTAIEQAVAPLKAQIEELQTRLNATQVNPETIATALNDQEWFWTKINDYVDSHMETRQPQQDTLSPEQTQQVRNIATELILNIDYTDAIGDAFSNSSIVEDAVEHYIRDYDFSEIVADNVEGVVENQLSNYDFREIVGDILEDARITL